MRRGDTIACFLALSLAAISSAASQSLVDKRVYIEPTSNHGGSAWIDDLLATAIAAKGTPLVAFAPAEADETLSLEIDSEQDGRTMIVATLKGKDRAASIERFDFILPSLDSADLVDVLATPLADKVSAALPPAPQAIVREETIRTVDSVSYVDKAQGVEVALKGPPGLEISTTDGRRFRIGKDGLCSLGELPQDSDVIVSIVDSRYFKQLEHYRVGTEAVTFAIQARLLPRVDVVTLWGSTFPVPTLIDAGYEVIPEVVKVSLRLGGNLSDRLQNGPGSALLPAFVEPGIGASAQLLPRFLPVRLWAGLQLVTRFDNGSGGWGPSTTLRAGIELPFALEIDFGSNFALRSEFSALTLFVGDPPIGLIVEQNRNPALVPVFDSVYSYFIKGVGSVGIPGVWQQGFGTPLFGFRLSF